jgi:glucose-1-phosphate cytidylyltransferase
MKVVILCGGMGTRISEETDYRPKPMIEIGGKPILWHIMNIYSFFGFNEFVLCLGYKGEMIKEYFLNFEIMNSDFTIEFGNKHKDINIHSSGSTEDWKVTLVDTGLHTMSGSRLKKIAPYIDTENFMLTYGDGVADINIKNLVDFHMSHKKTATITGVKPLARFGLLSVEGDNVIDFSEKPQVKEGYINGGFFVLNRKIFEYIDKGNDCIFERKPVQQLSHDGELMLFHHDGYWHCMDTIRDMRSLEEEWQKDKPAWKIWR